MPKPPTSNDGLPDFPLNDEIPDELPGDDEDADLSQVHAGNRDLSHFTAILEETSTAFGESSKKFAKNSDAQVAALGELTASIEDLKSTIQKWKPDQTPEGTPAGRPFENPAVRNASAFSPNSPEAASLAANGRFENPSVRDACAFRPDSPEARELAATGRYENPASKSASVFSPDSPEAQAALSRSYANPAIKSASAFSPGSPESSPQFAAALSQRFEQAGASAFAPESPDDSPLGTTGRHANPAFKQTAAFAPESPESESRSLFEVQNPAIRNASAFSPNSPSRENISAYDPPAPHVDPTFKSPNMVPGRETGRDGVDAKLKAGEFIIRPEAVKAVGPKYLEHLNATLQRPEAHATGGNVGTSPINTSNTQMFARGGSVQAGENHAKRFAVGGEAMAGFRRWETQFHDLRSDHAASRHQYQNLNAGNQYSPAAQAGRDLVSGYHAGERSGHGSIVAATVSGAVQGGQMGGAIGAAAGGLVAAFKSVTSAASDAAKNLAQYDARASMANAKANVRQITGDIQRARFISPELTRFTDVSSRFSQSAQNAQAAVMKAALQQLVPLLEKLMDLVDKYGGAATEVFAEVSGQVDKIIQFMASIGATNQVLALISKFVAASAKELKAMNTKTKIPPGGVDLFMQAFLDGKGMDTSHENEGVFPGDGKRRVPGPAWDDWRRQNQGNPGF